MKLSASSLNLFLRCPYAYYLKELEKVQPAYSERVFIGKLVHKTLENYFLY
ncbi:MAG: PD-(D/E)XK nuclease family protein, partial [Brevundimonas sp.]